MKLLIASDIHGSALYCRRLLEAYRSEGADRLLLLGDTLYHGPRNDLPAEYAPKEVTRMLNDIAGEIFAVRGNCDAEIDQMVLGFPMMADYSLIFSGTRTVFLTHGHIYDESNHPALRPGDVLIHGHTHIPACEEHGGIIYMNPGSVSIPKENSAHGYMLFEDDRFTWKTLDGTEYMSYTLT